ncbi:MAG: SPOR domain-containing protein [Pseudomonadota bacterium]
MKNKQTGSVIVGIIIGVVLGLAAALAVAVYVTKVPVPFLNKGQNRSVEQDAAESRKNRDWDPNAPLYGKNPARAVAPASEAAALPAPSAFPPASAASSPSSAAARRAASAASAAVAARKRDDDLPPAVRGRPASDPIGELAAARIGTGPGGDPFLYFVQVGAFRTAEDAEAHRAKLSLMGIEARITEREQSGRQVFRVRLGPFDKKDEADRQKERLESSGVETALVRVQR